MNKKLLFGIMSLAALTACTNDEFESKNIAQETSPIQFEVLNNDATTRASMNGNKIEWNANDGDKFTLYHGGTVAGAAPYYLSGAENAIYTASTGEGKATLSTPTMIKPGSAVMVWPVDSAFRVGAGNISVVIPAEQTNIEDHIPYVSDVVNIAAYNNKAPYNTAGLNRAYPIWMRPMASQLIIKADYADTDKTLASLYTGDDPIEEIEVTSIELITDDGGADKFTTEIPLIFTPKSGTDNTRWNTTAATKVANNAWSHVTGFHNAATTKVDKLTSKVLAANNGGCKFLMLPQANVASGVDDGAVVVNTLYGKVVVATGGAQGSTYDATEAADAWYRYISAASKTAGAGVGYDATETPAASAEASGDNKGKFKTTSKIENGMMQTINGFSTYTHQGTSPVQTEPEGAAATRYVKVLLTHLDMTDLHVKSDKQLRDVAKVWKKMSLANVTVYLDGDANKEFAISQTTIAKINEINNGTLNFQVKPCTVGGEQCETIVITGGGEVPNIAFITDNGGTKADVALNAGEDWNWPGTDNTSASTKKIKVQAAGVKSIINKGTMENAATATLATYENDGTQNNVPFKNEGTWNITAGTKLNVQFDVTNIGTLNIAAGAQYRMDGLTQNVKFDNEAETLPQRMLDIVAPGTTEKVGVVNNAGVFATVAAAGKTANINNYGLIEHMSLAAKTYITTNQLGGNFANAFNKTTNKMGMINFPWDCKAAENVSISNALNTGFVAVTVNGEVTGELRASEVGSKVNYVIIKSGVTSIRQMAGTVKYLEINEPGTEIAWKVSEANTFTGLVILSDVNITQGTTVNVTNAFLGADMYVGGNFNLTGNWVSYYGDTSAKFATNYFTF